MRKGAAARISARVGGLDWAAIADALDRDGFAVAGPFLTATECRVLAALYDLDRHFRQTIDMERYRFGEGQYRYFGDPVPPMVTALRRAAYPRLVPIANRWNAALGVPGRYPPDHEAFREQCHARGQSQPTPLLLRYTRGGYNCLHQDIYGDVAFPFQMTCLLSEPGRDFEGGEFLLVEQRPRAQSRGTAVMLGRGSAIIFPNRWRPIRSGRGVQRAELRHGVSPVRRGTRVALGVIFHDAA